MDHATIPTDEAYARHLDREDPLAAFRERFYLTEGQVYLDGNSLGALSRDAEETTLDALAAWKRHGVAGWLDANPPWFTLGETLGDRMAALVGAAPGSVVATGSTTINLHQMAGAFYHPTESRRKIVATALDFPSDIYALKSLIGMHGGDPEQDLVRVPSRDGRTIEEDEIVAAMGEDVALILLPSVLYRSGQLLDIDFLTREAHRRGIVIGFDCAHSAGAVPHRFDEWDVDFAVWCTYKYLNAGPGSVGALYVNARHAGVGPMLAGWWGYRKDRQFEMSHEWEAAEGAGRFQVSTVPVLSAAPLLGALAIHEEAGIERIREKSLALTSYLMALLQASGLTEAPYNFALGSPRDPARRGGHVAVEHEEAESIAVALRERGIVPDFRKPNVIRLAPVALYTGFHDIWRAVMELKAIVDEGAHRRSPLASNLVT